MSKEINSSHLFKESSKIFPKMYSLCIEVWKEYMLFDICNITFFNVIDLFFKNLFNTELLLNMFSIKYKNYWNIAFFFPNHRK